MPIRDMRFEDGIFYARQTGLIDDVDARTWVEALQSHAAASPTPIVALVDAREVEFVSANASAIFVEGASTPNVKVAAVVTRRTTTTIKARTIGLMGEPHHTHETYVFNSLLEAEKFAKASIQTG
ncbi:MAG: hypothetical protein K8I30_12210 [Anaerolineae bacterium]|nr:hypothetical protein [Anaerolineae bacterium]